MKLITKEELIQIDVFVSDSNAVIPRLYLDNPRIVLSREYKKYDEVHMNNELIGSKKFLDVDNEIDIMVFHGQDLSLRFIDIGIPFDISERSLGDIELAVDKVHNLSIDSIESFSLGKAEIAVYNQIEDAVLIFYKTYKEYLKAHEVLIGKDFSILFQEDVIVGWKLVNSCNYICEYFGNYQTTKSKDGTNILNTFFHIHSESTFEKMENQDLAFKKELNSLKAQAETNEFYVIAEIIEEWIEDYY